MWKTNPALLLCACREKCVCEKKDVKQWSTRLTVLTMLTKWTSVWPINVDGHPWVDVVVQRMTVTLDVNTGHPFGWPLGWLEVDLKLTFGWPSWSRSTRPHSSPLFVGEYCFLRVCLSVHIYVYTCIDMEAYKYKCMHTCI